MYRIDYLKHGTESVPDKWAYGEVVSYKFVPCDYKCMELEIKTRKEADERARKLAEIVNDYGEKKYHDITITEYEPAPIVGYSIIGFSCNMFHTKEDAIKYAEKHKKQMPNGFFKEDGTIDEWFIRHVREDEVEENIAHLVYMEECDAGAWTKEQLKK